MRNLQRAPILKGEFVSRKMSFDFELDQRTVRDERTTAHGGFDPGVPVEPRPEESIGSNLPDDRRVVQVADRVLAAGPGDSEAVVQDFVPDPVSGPAGRCDQLVIVDGAESDVHGEPLGTSQAALERIAVTAKRVNVSALRIRS